MLRSPQRTPDQSPASSSTELTPVHARTSRRLQGLQPQHGLLPERTRMTSQPPPVTATASHLVVNHTRTPNPFHGDASEDADDWLDHFERVANLNDWNQERKLRYVYFALEDAAKTWFENHEATLTSWDEFRRQFLNAFARVDRKERAELAMEARIQGPNERVTAYVEDMSRLFRRADPSMPESKKVRHLMRGVKQEIFAGLIRNPPSTLAEFHDEATAMEKALQQRARQFNRDALIPRELSSVTMGNDVCALRELIRAVVKEELQKMQATATAPVEPLSIAEIVRAEVRQAVHVPGQYEGPQTQGQRVDLNYAEAVRRPPPINTYEGPQMQGQRVERDYTEAVRRPPPPNAYSMVPPARQMEVSFGSRSPPLVAEARPRKCDVWRTPDYRPLCYHCGEAGHVYRMCPYRRVGLRGFSPNAPRPRPGERPPEIENFVANRPNVSQRWHEPRSSSPARYRSPSPAFSRGTPRRRSPSPAGREN